MIPCKLSLDFIFFSKEITSMGLAYSNLLIKNPKREDLQPISVVPLADTGSVYLIIPEHVRGQLELEEHSKKEIELADGTKHFVPYVGPIEIAFKNRIAFVGAIVMGTEVLLGAIPMEDMDLVLRPQLQSLDVNPDSPNIAVSLAKKVK